MTEPALRLLVADLACRRGGRGVFAGLEFALGPGDAAIVTGPNGAGKSTLLAALAGTLRPERGTVALAGIGDRGRAERLHHLGHRDGLKAALTAAENLRFAADLLGDGGPSPAEALAAVGLPGAGDLPAGFLSAGQRRRVALARLLVAPRPLWLLDEPTTALDNRGLAMLDALLARHLADGGLLVVATHAPLAIAGARRLALDPAFRRSGGS